MTAQPTFAAVVKVGGSLSRGPHLPTLCHEVGRLARRYPLLIVPGGAAFADAVRAAARRYTLGDDAAHWMAILGMDQYGYLLADLIPGAVAARDLTAACAAVRAGRAAVVLPFALLRHADPLPHSWTVTSDSIAAWLCGHVGAPLLALLKDVAGLYSTLPPPGTEEPPLATVALDELRPGGVDAYLARLLTPGMEAWAISGAHPERLTAFLEGRRDVLGTRLTAR